MSMYSLKLHELQKKTFQVYIRLWNTDFQCGPTVLSQ